MAEEGPMQDLKSVHSKIIMFENLLIILFDQRIFTNIQGLSDILFISYLYYYLYNE